jgi:hypothetical protein
MSVPMRPPSESGPPFRRRLAALGSVAAAHLLTKLSPRRVRTALTLLSRGARPVGDTAQVRTARDAVVAVSRHCAGEGCLQRSVATVLLCRLRGVWPTWCAGVRTDPFRAHAWVEVDGVPVGEPYPPGYFHPLMAVPAPRRPSE